MNGIPDASKISIYFQLTTGQVVQSKAGIDIDLSLEKTQQSIATNSALVFYFGSYFETSNKMGKW